MVACGEPNPDNEDLDKDPDTEITTPEEPEHENERVCIRGTEDMVYNKFSEYGISYIEFGMYPQTKVSDETVIMGLNAFATNLPTATNFNGWTSEEIPNEYGVKVNEKPDYFFFKDVKYEGNYYRALYFTEIRKYNPGSVTIAGQGEWSVTQTGKGYQVNTVYWFKYEPIVWEIMSDYNGEMLLLCKKVIDSNYWNYNGVNISSNYENSTVRSYLNNTFLYYAFTKAERELIFANLWQNDGESARDLANRNVCDDTYDKIALPSMAELSNTALGYSDNLIQEGVLGEDVARTKQCTDFVHCQGVHKGNGPTDYYTNYWMRSPGQNPRTVLYVRGTTGVSDNTQIASCMMGLLPIMYAKSK